MEIYFWYGWNKISGKLYSDKKLKNSVHNSEAFSSFASLFTDPRLVSVELKLSLCKNRKKFNEKFYD